jgi:hypothetical protein
VAGSFDLYVLLCTAQGWADYPFAQVDGVTYGLWSIALFGRGIY